MNKFKKEKEIMSSAAGSFDKSNYFLPKERRGGLIAPNWIPIILKDGSCFRILEIIYPKLVF